MRAANAVVPLPIKGSNTVSPAKENILSNDAEVPPETRQYARLALHRRNSNAKRNKHSIPLSSSLKVFLFNSRNGGFALFLEYKDKLVIYLENAVTRIGKTSHNSPAAGRIHRSLLLPYHSPHIIHSEHLAKADYFRSDWDDLITAVIYRSGELVAYIDAQPTTVVQNTIALSPNRIQIVYIAFIAVMKTDLSIIAIIFQLPIWRRSYYKMN